MDENRYRYRQHGTAASTRQGQTRTRTGTVPGTETRTEVGVGEMHGTGYLILIALDVPGTRTRYLRGRTAASRRRGICRPEASGSRKAAGSSAGRGAKSSQISVMPTDVADGLTCVRYGLHGIPQPGTLFPVHVDLGPPHLCPHRPPCSVRNLAVDQEG